MRAAVSVWLYASKTGLTWIYARGCFAAYAHVAARVPRLPPHTCTERTVLVGWTLVDFVPASCYPHLYTHFLSFNAVSVYFCGLFVLGAFISDIVPSPVGGGNQLLSRVNAFRLLPPRVPLSPATLAAI